MKLFFRKQMRLGKRRIVPYSRISLPNFAGTYYYAGMDQINTYKSFLSGRYFYEGIRATIGIVLPSFALSYSGNLPLGIVMSAGALCVSITDIPGPLKYRFNGMLACILLMMLNVLLAGYLSFSPVALGFLIVASGFFFSMLTVYGMRAQSIGVATLLILIINLDTRIAQGSVEQHALMIGAGGAWYMLYSTLLYRIRPYKIIQQVLGDFVLHLAAYLRTRGQFYETQANIPATYQKLLQQQVRIEEEQQLLSELIFKTRAALKDSNHTARVLVKMYLDAADMLESVMTTYHDYEKMHRLPAMAPLLSNIHEIIRHLSDEWVEIGIAIKTGQRSFPGNALMPAISSARIKFDQLRAGATDHETIDLLVSIGRILENVEDLRRKTKAMHFQTTYDKKIRTASVLNPEAEYQPVHKSIQPSIFINNLNFQSGIFRHAVRVSLALLIGYIIAEGFNLGHGNWILLTILVIMKPAYSLTKKRNRDRLVGTLIGLGIGVGILYFIQHQQVLWILMILLMLGSFVFIKTNYFWAVIMLTPELMILFSFIYPGSTETVLRDRLFDTVIGSSIAAVFSIWVLPSWEQKNIRSFMETLLIRSRNYYDTVAAGFSGTFDEQALRKNRRLLLIALANVSDTFTRMLSEPKQYQTGIEFVHRFVVLNYSITSHITTLLYLKKQQAQPIPLPDVHPVMVHTLAHFDAAIQCIRREEVQPVSFATISMNHDVIQRMVQARKEEIRNGMLETPLKNELIAVKSITDQFQYIQGLVVTLAKLCKNDYMPLSEASKGT
ncbi:MAG TPA: FUSC family membrane protein [Ferruginibacter sp.]|nr:FUSC family membrane protein [Ferruginibacter sp.]HRO17493.1 FUSC family membrane protein [Ferruginibacter sp.]HRQ20254.1 FUSC family membrane protein [Ferruginibacter sp.]